MELSLPVSQALALFVKVVRKISKVLIGIQKAAIVSEMPPPPTSYPSLEQNASATMTAWKPVEMSLEEELEEAGNEAVREKQREMIDSLDLTK